MESGPTRNSPVRPVRRCPDEMTVRRAGHSIIRSPAGISTVPFWAEVLLESEVEGENTVMQASVEPGVVTNWHTHPRGQFLYVLSGVGCAQRDGGPIVELRAGDCVWFAPGERHWHGAGPNSTFCYISIQAEQDGVAVSWHEPVTPISACGTAHS